MTDRHLRADQMAHARRTTGQPEPEPALREQIAAELARIRSRFAETWIEVSRRDMRWLLANVDLLTAERDGHRSGREQLRAISREHRAERDRYRLAWLSAGRRATAERAKATRLVALMERGFDTHMQFGVIEPDGTTTMLPCADWCYACKLEKAERHVEELQDKLLSFGDNGGCCCSYEGPGDVCLSHSPTVRQLTAEREQLRANLRTAAGLLRDTAERAEQQRTVNAGVLRGAAKAMDEITGSQP